MMSDAKSLSQQRFSRYAERYVQSAGHAQGSDLTRLLELGQPQSHELVMDIATGGGHTALTFAPHVRHVVAADLSQSMLEAARNHHLAQNALNLTYINTDAERLAFASNTFDLMTCRIAPHHFPDIFRFVLECARVLKPGGRLLIQDQTVPEHERAARYIDAFERLRDPSHHRIYSEVEWRGTYLDAGLTVDHTELVWKQAQLVPWAEVQDCSPDMIDRLQILLAQAPDAVRDWLKPTCVGTPDAEFLHGYVLILGRKEAK
jgi:ubiquinone/menaquinone biosynthesis C-methylase UbiE